MQPSGSFSIGSQLKRAGRDSLNPLSPLPRPTDKNEFVYNSELLKRSQSTINSKVKRKDRYKLEKDYHQHLDEKVLKGRKMSDFDKQQLVERMKKTNIDLQNMRS